MFSYEIFIFFKFHIAKTLTFQHHIDVEVKPKFELESVENLIK
jgi:hypothetical protein